MKRAAPQQHYSSQHRERPADPKRQSRTLPRKTRSGKASSSPSKTNSSSSSKSILPPPPQYKGVHFAPNVKDTMAAAAAASSDLPPPPAIPLEGLPKGPAKPHRMSNSGDTVVVISSASETVPITVRKSSGPPVPIKPKITASSSMTFAASPQQKQQQQQQQEQPPPVPPHQTSIAKPVPSTSSSSKPHQHKPLPPPRNDDVRFESPDEGFNEEDRALPPPPPQTEPTAVAKAATEAAPAETETGPLLR